MPAGERIGGPPDSAWSQLGRLRRDFLAYLLDAARYGDLVRLRPAPGVTIFLVNHPALMHEVLVTQAQHFSKTRMTRRMVGRFLGEGLVLAEGETHRRQRRLAQPAFHGRRIDALAPRVAGLTHDMIAGWQDGDVRDLDAAFNGLMLRVLVDALFGVDANDPEIGVADAMQVFADSISQRFRSLPLPQWLPTPRHRREHAAVARLDRAIARMIELRRARPDAGEDLLSRLLSAQAQSDGVFSADELRDQVATLYFAAHETTSRHLLWTAHLLATHSASQARLIAEARALDAGACSDANVLGALPLLDAVLRESLRLYPPAWLFDRETLTEVRLGDFCLPRGASLYLSPYVMGRDARCFAAPESFDDMRFAPGWETRTERHAYLPFGTGPRNCIGRGFAEIAARAVLVTLLRAFRLEAVAGQDEHPQPLATLRPKNGLRFRLRRQGPCA